MVPSKQKRAVLFWKYLFQIKWQAVLFNIISMICLIRHGIGWSEASGACSLRLSTPAAFYH